MKPMLSLCFIAITISQLYWVC